MPSHTAPWRAEILKMLREAEYHMVAWEVLIQQAGRHVPPGRAWRTFVTDREALATRAGRPLPVRPKPGDAEAIASGRRKYVTGVLNYLRREGLITYDSAAEGRTRYVTLSSCPCCGRPY